MAELAYIGTELDVFAHAQNWKRYVSRHLERYISGSVLEVGAGIGSNALVLSGNHSEWICLEPDPSLAARIGGSGKLRHCKVIVGMMADLPADNTFDTILYFDVLEHIREDRAEMEIAATHLKPGGHIAVLSPAHQWLYTPFDEAIGHYRRYNRQSLVAVAPPSLKLEKLVYLDSAGLSLSAANRLVLQSSSPSARQIKIWDHFLVPVSRVMDPMLRYRLGKSILAVWRNARP
jgi:SAM-dependent methyltransferase